LSKKDREIFQNNLRDTTRNLHKRKFETTPQQARSEKRLKMEKFETEKEEKRSDGTGGNGTIITESLRQGENNKTPENSAENSAENSQTIDDVGLKSDSALASVLVNQRQTYNKPRKLPKTLFRNSVKNSQTKSCDSFFKKKKNASSKISISDPPSKYYDLVTGQPTKRSITSTKLFKNISETSESKKTEISENISSQISGTSQNNNPTEVIPPSRGSRCPICMEVAKDPMSGKCGHICCSECWDHWLAEKLECPVCKTRLRRGKLIKVFIM